MAETLNLNQLGPFSDLPLALSVGVGDKIMIDTPGGKKQLDYATLLAAITQDAGDAGDPPASGVGNLTLRHVPTDIVADGSTSVFTIRDTGGDEYTPAASDVVFAFVGGVMDATVTRTGSAVTFGYPPPNGEVVRLAVFSPVSSGDVGALDDRYVQLVASPVAGQLASITSGGGIADSNIAASSVLTTASVGVANGIAALDNSSKVPSASLPDVALLGAAGDAFAAAHPADASGHPLVTTTVAGFMSASDKTKLDGLPNSVNINSGVVQIVMASGTYTGSVEVNVARLNAAPLASPALTGTPTAPTAAAGTNTTQIATTAFVQGEKASPALTGTPTAPTAAAATNTTQIATTAFVRGEFNAANLSQYATTAYVDTSKQPLDDTLTGLAAVAANGFPVVTDHTTGAVAARTFVAGSGITITNSDGVAGNPTIAASSVTAMEVTTTPVATFRPLTSMTQGTISNIGAAGVTNAPTGYQFEYMDLSQITEVDFQVVVTTANAGTAKMGPRFSPNGGTTWYAADGTTITASVAPANAAASGVQVNVTGPIRAKLAVPAVARTNATLVSYYAWSGTGSDSVTAPSIRISAPATTVSGGGGGGGGSWGSITGTLSAQTDLQAALDAKLSVTTRGAIDGVASLDATGKVPTSQLPAVAGGGDVFNAGSYGLSPTASAATNDAALASFFSAIRAAYASTGRLQVAVVPPGTYSISTSIRPSGSGANPGAHPGISAMKMEGVRWSPTGAATGYAEILRGPNPGLGLNNFGMDIGDCGIAGGNYLLTSTTQAVRKYVVFDARNMADVEIDHIEIVRSSVIDNLVAISSTGGTDGLTGGYFFRRACVGTIDIQNFEVGIYAAHMYVNDTQVDSLTCFSCGKYHFTGKTAIFADNNVLDGSTWGLWNWRQVTGPSHIFSCPAIDVGSFFVAIGSNDAQMPALTIGKSCVNFGAVYIHLNTGALARCCFDMYKKGKLIIKSLHNDTGGTTGFTYGLIHNGRDGRDAKSADAHVFVNAISAQTLADADNLNKAIIGCNRGSAETGYNFSAFVAGIDTTNGWDIKAYKTTSTFATSSTDAITGCYAATGMRPRMRFNSSGVLTDF